MTLNRCLQVAATAAVTAQAAQNTATVFRGLGDKISTSIGQARHPAVLAPWQLWCMPARQSSPRVALMSAGGVQTGLGKWMAPAAASPGSPGVRPQSYQAPEVVASGSPMPAQVACLHFLVTDCSHACLPACLPVMHARCKICRRTAYCGQRFRVSDLRSFDA